MSHMTLPDPEQMSSVYHQWLASLPFEQDKPPNTVRAYGQALRRVCHYASLDPTKFAPKQLSQARLTDAVRSMRSSQEVSKATLNQTLAAVGSFFDWCIAERRVATGPDIRRIRRIAKLAAEELDPEYYQQAELRSLLEATGNVSGSVRIRWPRRDLAICSFLAALGLRATELCDLRLDSLVRERAEVDVAENAKEVALDEGDEEPDPDNRDETTEIRMLHVRGKGGKLRRLPLSAPLGDVVDDWLEARREWTAQVREEAHQLRTVEIETAGQERWQESQDAASAKDDLASSLDPDTRPPDRIPLFVTNSGERFNYPKLHYLFRRLNLEAGLRSRTPHALRHTAGVQLALDGIPMNVIQRLLGHASVSTTGIYTAIAGRELEVALQRASVMKIVDDTLTNQRSSREAS